MRIIAGRFKGRVLTPLEGRQTRPMTDRIKENIFNILGAKFGTPGHLPDGAVLDIFAGTGGLGIEALSRGASFCTFVEQHRTTLKTLRANLEKLHHPELWSLRAENAWTMRVPAPDGADGYSLVFVDPPYRDAEDVPRVCDLLQRVAARLLPNGVILLRVERGTQVPESVGGALSRTDERMYGRMHLAFFERTDRPDKSALHVRSETEADRDAIAAVHRAAFDSPAEAKLVDQLRGTAAFIPELSLVAEQNGEIVGHLLLTRATITQAGDAHPALALAPMAVVPQQQRKGIGTMLMHEALQRASRLGHALIVVLGHPDFYCRFGFRRASQFGIRIPFPAPDEACLCRWLVDEAAQSLGGMVQYPAPFSELAD